MSQDRTEQIAFKMHLNAGMRDEYKRRHDEIFPELLTLLRGAGVLDYSIYLDEQSNILFAVLTRKIDHQMDNLPGKAIMQKWWAHMADIMKTNALNEPASEELPLMFHMGND